LSYLLGSIPFGYVLTKLAGKGDIRQIGSGNIGATNVLRTGSKKLAALTMLLDSVKGAVAVLIAAQIDPAVAPVAGLAAFAGHVFPVWLKFKGGKGVATAEGILVALCWPAGIITMALWIIVLKFSRLSSLAALVSVTLSSVVVCLFGYEELIWFTVIITLLIYWTHRANIRRLINGTEPKIGMDKNAAPSA
jgi:glycerol-3-phosphate acyltransferase PlsY